MRLINHRGFHIDLTHSFDLLRSGVKLRVTGEGVAEFEELWAARERGCRGDAISDKIFSLSLADRTYKVYMKWRRSEYPTKVLIFFPLQRDVGTIAFLDEIGVPPHPLARNSSLLCHSID